MSEETRSPAIPDHAVPIEQVLPPKGGPDLLTALLDAASGSAPTEDASQMLYAGTAGLDESCVVNIKNRSHTVTAEVVVPSLGAEGVIVNQGGTTGGWALYVEDGRPAYTYNFCSIERSTARAAAPLPPGRHQVRLQFDYEGGGPGRGGTATLFVDDEPAGSTRITATHPAMFSFDETTDVGRDTGTPVTDAYPSGAANTFTGEIAWVRIDLGADHRAEVPLEHHLEVALTHR